VEEALYALLSADATITGLVSTRIYPILAPQNAALPYVTYQVAASRHVHSLDGSSGLAFASVQINCNAASYSVAKAIAEAVRQELQGYAGTPVVDGTEITGVIWDSDIDSPDVPQTATEAVVHRVIVTADVGYVESVPA